MDLNDGSWRVCLAVCCMKGMFSRVLYTANTPGDVNVVKVVQEPREERTLRKRTFEPMVRFWGQRLCHMRVANDYTTLGSIWRRGEADVWLVSLLPLSLLTLESRGLPDWAADLTPTSSSEVRTSWTKLRLDLGAKFCLRFFLKCARGSPDFWTRK